MEKLKLTAKEREDILSSMQNQLDNCKRLSAFKPTIDTYLKLDPKKYKKPVIQIPADIYMKMFALVKTSNVEIQWHGLINRDIKNQIYTIYDIFLPPQINSPTATTTDDKKFALWIEEKITDFTFPIQDMRLHGHSHVNMNVFSSSIDDAYQIDLLSKVNDGDYYLFLVLNKKNDICALLYDMDQGILFETKDLIIEIIDKDGNDLNIWAEDQIDEYCIESRPIGKYNNTATNMYSTPMGIYSDLRNKSSEPIFETSFRGGKK